MVKTGNMKKRLMNQAQCEYVIHKSKDQLNWRVIDQCKRKANKKNLTEVLMLK